MGVLNQDLFTAIVAMAVVTTMSMPPMLRWALARLPISSEEAARLEREEFEAKGFVSNIERLLVAVDASPSGQFTSRLVGLLAGARRIATTVIHFDYETQDPSREGARRAERTKAVVRQSAEEGDDAGFEKPGSDPVEIATRVEKPGEEAISAEARKGYGLLFIGREPASEGDTFHEQITRSAVEFAGRLRSRSPAVSIGEKRRERHSTFSYLSPGPPLLGRGPSWQSRWHKPPRGPLPLSTWPADREGLARGGATSARHSLLRPVPKPSSARLSD